MGVQLDAGPLHYWLLSQVIPWLVPPSCIAGAVRQDPSSAAEDTPAAKRQRLGAQEEPAGADVHAGGTSAPPTEPAATAPCVQACDQAPQLPAASNRFLHTARASDCSGLSCSAQAGLGSSCPSPAAEPVVSTGGSAPSAPPLTDLAAQPHPAANVTAAAAGASSQSPLPTTTAGPSTAVCAQQQPPDLEASAAPEQSCPPSDPAPSEPEAHTAQEEASGLQAGCGLEGLAPAWEADALPAWPTEDEEEAIAALAGLRPGVSVQGSDSAYGSYGFFGPFHSPSGYGGAAHRGVSRAAGAAPKRKATVTWADQAGAHTATGLRRPSAPPKRYAAAFAAGSAGGNAQLRRSAGVAPLARPSAFPPPELPAEGASSREESSGLRTGRDLARARVPLGQAV